MSIAPIRIIVTEPLATPLAAFEGDLTALNASVATALAPDRPIIETGGQSFGVPDQAGSYGGGPAVYVRALPQYFRATTMGAAGNLTITGAATSGRMAGFVKLPVTDPDGTTKRIIVNFDTQTCELLDADGIISASKYMTIGMFVVGQPGVDGHNGFRWLNPELSHVFPTAPAVVDHGELLIPRSSIISTATNGFDAIIPEDGSWFFPRSIQSDPTVASRYIYDKSLKDVAGGTYNAAVKRVDGLNAPLDDSYKQILLATSSGGFVSSEYFQIVGEQGTPPAEDQNPLGIDADAYPIRVNSTITDFTDPAILAMGITRGAIGPTSGSDRSVYFGLPIKPKFGQYGVARFVAEVQGTVNSGNYLTVFSEPRLLLRQGGTPRSSATIRMIRRLSDKAAEFIAWIGVATDNTEDMIVGFSLPGASYNVIVSPFSDHFSEIPALWIARPGEGNTDLAISEQWFGTRGRLQALYPGRITKNRPEMVDFVATIGSGTAGYNRSGKEMIIVDPDKLGSTIDIEIRNRGAKNNRSRKRATVYLGPAAVVAGSVVRPLLADDSRVGYGMPIAVAQSGQRLGYSVQPVGTLMNDGGGTPTAPLYPGEGHPGKTVAQMVGKAAGMDPIPPADFSAYLAMSDADKNNRNPFLKPFVGGDPVAYRVTLGGSDYVWSMAYYISRTGFAAPTHFIFGGGRNDIFFDPANAVANVEFGFDVRYNQTRAAYPNAPIFFTYFGEPVSVENERDWPAEYAIIQAYHNKVATARLAGDNNIYFIDAFAFTTPEMWNDLTVTSTSVESGTQKGVISDTTHMGPISKPEAANCIMDAINATSGAVAADNLTGTTIDAGKFGFRGDNMTDNAQSFTALAAFLSGSPSYLRSVKFPAGVYRTSQPITLDGNHWSIEPESAGTTIWRYTGTSATADFLTIGNGGTTRTVCNIGDILIDSTTTMTAGAAVHYKKVSNFDCGIRVVGAARYNPASKKIYNGIWFDQIDNGRWHGQECYAANDGIRVNGTAGAGLKADLAILGCPKIEGAAVGIHVAGGFGGLYLPSANLIKNTKNIRVSTDYCAEGNRELFFGSEMIADSSLGANVEIVDALAGTSSFIHFDGSWIASAAAGFDNVLIDGYVGIVQFDGGTIYKAGRDGVRVNSAAVVLLNGVNIRENGAWGVNPTITNHNVRLVNCPNTLNVSGFTSKQTAVAVTFDANKNQSIGGENTNYGFSGFAVPRVRIAGYADYTAGGAYQAWVNSNRGGTLQFMKSRGITPGDFTAAQNGDEIARFMFGASDGASFQRAVQILFSVGGAVAAGSVPGRIALSVTGVGGASPAEKAALESSGDISVAGMRTFANDTAAGTATPPVPINGLYNDTNGFVKKRIT